MNKFYCATILLSLAVTSTFAANGQYKDGPFIALPMGGDIENENIAGGWQATYEYNDIFSIEGVLAGQTDEITADIASEPIDAELELNILSLSFTGRAGWFFDPVGLYVGAGAGYYYFDADAEASRISAAESSASLPPGVLGTRLGSDIEDAIGYHLAVGAEWLLSGTWEVFAEYRYVFLDTDARYRVTETRATTSGPVKTFTTSRTRTEEISYDHGMLRVGINYRF